MNRSSNRLLDPIRLLLLLVLLPLLLILSGPLLMIAAVRGALSIGAFQLQPGKYYRWGRFWALVLGLMLTIVIWGGAAWFWLQRGPIGPFSQPPVDIADNPVNFVVTTPTLTLIATFTSTSPPAATATFTPENPAVVAATSSNTPPPTPTPTQSVALAEPPTVSPTPSPSPVPAEASEPLPSDLPAEPAQIVTAANDLLLAYLENGDATADTALATIWHEDALTSVRAFARQTQRRYQTPMTVTYTTVETPTVTTLDDKTISIRTREFWIYEGPAARRESLGQYDYTLQAADGVWKIVRYSFRALPVPAELRTITSTQVITAGSGGP